MSRPRRKREVLSLPDVEYFKPQGVPLKSLKEVVLSIEEYEALNLVDFQGLKQSEASQRMKVSQPTVFRMLDSARKKVSSAIIEGKAIRIRGGDYMIRGRGRQGGSAMGVGGNCVCPKCKKKFEHIRGTPCMSRVCPDCGVKLVRE